MGAAVPQSGLRLFVTDTLDDPNATVTNLGAGLELIARSRRSANEIKASQHVTVVIGNPPYRERAEGLGGWVEGGDAASGIVAPLDSFRTEGGGRLEHNLKNLYVYFWRWAALKVFDEFPDAGGVVCFITTSGYVRGPGFAGMRKYLRERASEGWIINVSPEGMRPPVNTRIFPGVQQPLAIGLFVRAPGTQDDVPASIRYMEMAGRRAEKYRALTELDLDGNNWRAARTGWGSPFTPAALSDWDDFIALNDLFPWSSPGVTGNRRWPMATTPEVLGERWNALISAPDTETKSELLKATDDRGLLSTPTPLPGDDTSTSTTELMHEHGLPPTAIPYGYRSLDRQWILPDNRLLDRPRPDLWRARIPGQVFAIEHHTRALTGGPAVVFSALIPDLDHFLTRHGGGGRALPMLHPNGEGTTPQTLTDALRATLDATVTSQEVMAYVAGVASHAGYTATFADELRTPGLRVPITADRLLWDEAVALGKQVIWVHTYGEVFSDAALGRSAQTVRYQGGDDRRVRSLTPVTALPDEVTYDESTQTIWIGDGSWGPVPREVIDFEIGMRNVIDSWFNYRRANTTGRVTSPLDRIMPTRWWPAWTNEFTELLSAIRRLVELEPTQSDLLGRILESPLVTSALLSDAGFGGVAENDRRPHVQMSAALDFDL